MFEMTRNRRLGLVWVVFALLAPGAMLHAAQTAVRVAPPAAANCPGGTCYARPGTYGYYATRWKRWPGSEIADSEPRRSTVEEVPPPAPAKQSKPAQAPKTKPPITTIPDDEEDMLPSTPNDTLPGLPGKAPTNPFQDEEELPSLDSSSDGDLSLRFPASHTTSVLRRAPGNPLRSLAQAPSERIETMTLATASDDLDSASPVLARLPADEPSSAATPTQWDDAQWPELANWPSVGTSEPEIAEAESSMTDDLADDAVVADDEDDQVQLTGVRESGRQAARDLVEADYETDESADDFEVGVSDDGVSLPPSMSQERVVDMARDQAMTDSESEADQQAASSRRSAAATRPAVDEPRRVVVDGIETRPFHESQPGRPQREKRGLGLNPLRTGKPRMDPAVEPASYNSPSDLPDAWLDSATPSENPLRQR